MHRFAYIKDIANLTTYALMLKVPLGFLEPSQFKLWLKIIPGASAMIQKSVWAVFMLCISSETDYEAKSTLSYIILS